MSSSAWPRMTIESLIASGTIIAHKDGNYGSLYPRVEEFGADGVPFLTAKSLDAGEIDIAGAPRLADDRADALRFGFVRPNDVLLSHNATIGRVAVVPQFEGRMLVGTSLTYFRLNSQNLLPRYFAAYLTGADFQNQLAAVMSHSTRNQVPITAQRTLTVVVPPLDVQHMIADTLGALDEKIAQNRRTGLALEGLAQATFTAWFVDFDPVKAKAAGQMSFPGMCPAAFTALPDRLTDSPIGPVPHGWAVRPLSKVADFLNGLALQKYPPVGDETDLPVIKIAELRKGSTQGGALANAGVPDAYVVDDGDLLFSWSGTLEAELWFGGRGALNQHLFKVTSDDYPRWLCLHWVRQHLTEFRLIASSKATTMGHIKRGHLDTALVAVPDKELLQAAGDVIGPLYDLHASLALETRKVASLRDYLLPQFLGGRLRECPSRTGVKA